MPGKIRGLDAIFIEENDDKAKPFDIKERVKRHSQCMHRARQRRIQRNGHQGA